MKSNPSHTGDPLFLPELLRFFGIEVREHPGWRDRGHGDFRKIQGIIVHHTGALTTPVEYIARHPALGLCSQIHLDREGVATICGAGIAYHAGRGEHPGWPTHAANQVSIGIEAQSDGTSPWPQAQLDAYHRICAAILWYLGLDATKDHLLGHKEYSGRAQGKWDPGGIDMDDFRRKVQNMINAAHVVTSRKGAFSMKPDERQSLDDIREQLTGSRTPGEYPGWAQLGGHTVVDALASLIYAVSEIKFALAAQLKKDLGS